jgi:predicted amidohydrolase
MSRIGFVQYDVRFGAAAENAATVRALTAGVQADLLVLPELALSGYDFPTPEAAREAAEPFGEGATFALATELAAATGAAIVAGYPERTATGCYNSALLVTPGGKQYNYRKIHLFNREQDLFLPGDAPPPVVETPAGRVGLMICFDWFFPEVARSLALRGADILAHPSNLVLPWCQRAMFARSVENAVFSITANRVGTEAQAGRSLTFTGGSQVMDPDGAVLAAADTTGAACQVVDVDIARARDKSRAGRNDLFANRRPELYPGL